jgi:hypothetical protein
MEEEEDVIRKPVSARTSSAPAQACTAKEDRVDHLIGRYGHGDFTVNLSQVSLVLYMSE